MNKEIKHLISANQITNDGLMRLFESTDKIVEKPGVYGKELAGKVIATMFFEPSTRTRLSFESAVQRLGAALISTENARENSSNTKGERLEDTIRMVDKFADAIIIRHSDDDSADRAASVSRVPIINAGSGAAEHPTQSLLDVYTIYKRKERLDNLTVALVGDLKYGRTPHSLIKLLQLFSGQTVYGLSDQALELPNEYIDELEKHGARYETVKSFNDLPRNLDAIYQTRVQRERINGNPEFKEFNITTEVMKHFSSETLVLHPLPRVDEICFGLDYDPRAVYFKQVENGLFVRMAILLDILKERK